jgi:SulP family sulfate permease
VLELGSHALINWRNKISIAISFNERQALFPMSVALFNILRREFRGYNLTALQKDVLAGLTVGAVALPLALAFGIASGANAPAGLVTAILSGLIIGGLSGAPYQISGPTGAMSAILILIARKYGLDGVWLICVISGLMILLVGVFRLGQIVSFIPRPVITGFTSGIAIIIFVGQLDNFLGIKTAGKDNAIEKLVSYFEHSIAPNWQTMLVAGVVFATIFLLPKSISKRVPGSLIGLALATLMTFVLGFTIPTIGEIPRTLILDQRLLPGDLLKAETLQRIPELIVPSISVAALGAIESLLCGAVCGNATGVKMDGDQELIAQGVGNLIIPFFGGVPATAAIARSSVGVASGGVTRLVSIVHALLLVAAVFLFGPVLSQVPLAALAGVLMATAIRMNEWKEIRWMFRHRFKSAIISFFVTMLATAYLDLTQAVVIGVLLSAALFIARISNVHISQRPVDVQKLAERGVQLSHNADDVSVAYVTGPIFFGAAAAFRKAFEQAEHEHKKYLILSMRGVPLIDVGGLELIEELWERQKKRGGELLLAAVQPSVKKMLDRAGLTDEIGAERFFWSADQAIGATQRIGNGQTDERAQVGL